jgi:hypothetical protein
MAEWKIGDELHGSVMIGSAKMDVVFKISGIDDGAVTLDGPGGAKQVVPIQLLPQTSVAFSTAAYPMAGVQPVVVEGLQPDPPEGIARVAVSTTMSVLPSPVAPEQPKIFNPDFSDDAR